MKEDLAKTVGAMGDNIPEKDFDFGMRLLHKRRHGQITQEEFLRECTYFMLKCGFDNLKPKPLPTRPQVLLDYDIKCRDAQAANRTYQAKESFWQQIEIKIYLEQRWKILQGNLGNKAWLKENLERLEEYGDPVNTMKVRQRIQEFEEWEQDNWQALMPYHKRG